MADSDCLLILSCDKRPIMASTHLEILVQCIGCVFLDKALLCNISVLHALIDTFNSTFVHTELQTSTAY